MSQTYIPTALRRLVEERARGYCEYCRVPSDAVFLPHEIDHILAEKHGGSTVADNLCLCCAVCNKRKGSDIASVDPENGEIVALYNPRRDRWEEHFRLLLDGQIVGKTKIGRTTVSFLQLNAAQRVDERSLLMAAGELAETL